MLDDQRETFPVGAGVVHRHSVKLATDSVPVALRPVRSTEDQNVDQLPNLHAWIPNMLNRIRNLVRSDHNWPLIYLVVIAFFFAAVPWHAWFSFKRVGYLGSIGTLLAIVAACTWVIYEVGRRGYGEASVVHSLSYAKELGFAGCSRRARSASKRLRCPTASNDKPNGKRVKRIKCRSSPIARSNSESNRVRNSK